MSVLNSLCSELNSIIAHALSHINVKHRTVKYITMRLSARKDFLALVLPLMVSSALARSYFCDLTCGNQHTVCRREVNN